MKDAFSISAGKSSCLVASVARRVKVARSVRENVGYLCSLFSGRRRNSQSALMQGNATGTVLRFLGRQVGSMEHVITCSRGE